MRNGRNRGQHKDRVGVRPMIKTDFPGGLTKEEIEIWHDRVSTVRAVLMSKEFQTEGSRWRDST